MIWDDKIGFGTAYYAEYHLRPRLESDLDVMAVGGFSVILAGESVRVKSAPRLRREAVVPLTPGQ